MNNNPLPNGVKYTDPTQLPAMLWLVEGNVLRLYADPEGIPTIGIGVNVTVAQNMAVVLNQISVNGVNLFAAAAAQGQTIEDVVGHFEAVIAAHPLSKSTAARNGQTSEERALQDALDTLAASYFNETLATFRNGAPASGNNRAVPAATATFQSFPSDAVQNVLSTLLSNDPQTIQGGAGPTAYGPYNINTYAQQLKQWLTHNTSPLIGASYNVPAGNVPPPNTGQWEALLSLFYNQNPKKPLIGKGLMGALQAGNVAQAWYQIRYAHANQDISRRYYESQMFGLAQPGDTAVQALQAYEMLEENRTRIISYEVLHGADPNGNNPDLNSANNQGNGIQVANANVSYAISINSPPAIKAPLYPVQTLTQAFDPMAEMVAAQLNALYQGILPSIGVENDTKAPGSFIVRSTNILVAPDQTDITNHFATASQDAVAVTDALDQHHILLGADNAGADNQDFVILYADGTGDDILIAGAGNEFLEAGAGNDTLIGGQGMGSLSGAAGSDTLVGGTGADTYIFALPSSGTLSETLVPLEAGDPTVIEPLPAATLEVSKGGSVAVLGGSASAPLKYNSALSSPGKYKVWSDGDVTYTLNVASDEMVITGGAMLGQSTIDIKAFNTTLAEFGPGGFMGVYLTPALNFTVGATQGVDPPVADFQGGSSQSYTLSLDVPALTAQTLTVTLSGAVPSDFEALVGNTLETLSSDGSFKVTLAAGDSNVAFTLIDMTARNGSSDLASGGTLTLSASLADPNAKGGAVQAAPITFNYVPATPDTGPAPQGLQSVTINGQVTVPYFIVWYDRDGNRHAVGGNDGTLGVFVSHPGTHGYFVQPGNVPNYWLDLGDTANNSIVGGSGVNYIHGGDGNNIINLSGTNDSVYLGDGFNTVQGSSVGQDSIHGNGGTNLIVGNGGTDLIFGGSGTNQIYAGAQSSLADAIARTQAATATNGFGDLISVLDGDNTIVGGTGNDFITAGTGHDVVVLGSGNDTFDGGWDVTDANTGWSASVTGSILAITGVTGTTAAYTNPFPQPYNGISDTDSGQPSSEANDTIFAGNGADLIMLGNGANFVQGGSGNDSIYGGMGEDTIYAGSGNTVVHGGGGKTYIYGGSGADTLRGGDGDNTIIGGTGNATIIAAHGPGGTNYTGASLENNYVFGGSGNDLITGAAGHDTLIAGSGNTTIQGGSGNESIVGGSGNDSLVAGSGNDTLEAGGAGRDTLKGGSGSGSSDVIYGGGGTDSILGGSGTNVLYAGDGGTAAAPTTVMAGQGAYTTLYGGAGVDYLLGGSGTNVMYAGAGGTSSAPTTLIAGNGTTTIYGGSGVDLIDGGSGTDVLYAGDGGTASTPTRVIAGSGVATLYGGAGSAFLQDQLSGADLIVSGNADDTLLGMGADTLVAGTGDDLIEATGSGVTAQFNAGFGNDSINPAGGTVNLAFGTGIASTDFTASLAFDAQYNSYLVLAGDGGSITIQNGATGAIGNLTFADSVSASSPSFAAAARLLSSAVAPAGSISLAQFLANAFGTDQTFNLGGPNYFLSVQDGESISAGSMQDTIAAYGSNDTLVANTGSGSGDFIFSAGSNASIVGGGPGIDSIAALGDSSSISGGSVGTDVTLGGANSVYTGTSGQDVIVVSGARDSVVGGSGNSTFYVNDSSAVISVAAGGAIDTVVASVSYTAPTNVSYLTLTGSASITATGNAGNDVLTGGAGNDTLIAGAGIATLIGGSGGTTFVVNNTSDIVQDSNAVSTNQVVSSVSFSLPTNVNVLVLTGTASLAGTANSGNDTLVSNSGVDTLVGGSGNDTFIINNPGDVIVAGSGSITVIDNFSGSYSLPAGAYTLALTGTANLIGTADGGNDTLISNSGVDTLYGGSGNDTFVINNSADVVIDTVTTTNNTVQSSVSYSLPTNVNTLILTGSAALIGTGNSAADRITANAGNDTLVSGSGLSTLIGGSGNDLFVVNNTGDVVIDSVTGTNDTIAASVSMTLGTNLDTLVFTGTANLAATVSNPDNDTLISNSGVDTFVGGTGDETYVINNSGDVIQDHASDLSSTVEASVSYTVPNLISEITLTGTADLAAVGTLDNNNLLMVANSGKDTLIGGPGFDTLVSGTGIDTLVAGSGLTIFVVNNSADVVQVPSFGNSFAVDSIQSSVSFVLPSRVNDLVLTGTANLTATAISGNNSLVGNAGNDVLQAGSGADTLISGSGIDTLIGGGSGSSVADTFVINNAADVIEGISGAAGNQVLASISYTLPTGIDVLTLTGAGNLLAVGNGDADSITANAGNDTLMAGSGIATLTGGRGADLFIVNNSNDVVSNPDQGSSFGPDTVESSVSYTLPGSVTILVLTGTADLVGAASGGSLIVGNGGNDTLIAGTGNTTLVAGTGVASLVGSAGSDTFIVNNSADVVVDSVSGNSNTVLSSVGFTLPTNVDALTLTGSANLLGMGNAENDSITGNAGADTLIAGSGNDTLVAGSGPATLVGGAGSDTFKVNSTADLIESASATGSNVLISTVSFTLPTNVNVLTLTGVSNVVGAGNGGNDIITGNAGSDTLVAGAGIATLIGGSGSTDFFVNNTADVVIDSYSSAANQIQSSVSYVLPIHVNTLVLTGSDNLTGTANGGADTLVSNSGVDTFYGGSGNDTFIINNSSDVVQDTSTSAANVVQASVSYSLSNNVNTLLLTGSANLSGSANNGNDTLVSNSGVDTLIGGAGNDTFIVGNAADVVQDTATAARNTIISSVSYSLPTNVNTLTLTGTASLVAMGNGGSDLIQANSGNDTLIAGAGPATLVGGAGDDVFVVTSSADVVQAGANAANSTIESSVSFTLPTASGLLQLTGTANLVAKAGSGQDTLISNSGVDTLIAGTGPDLIILNNPGDVIQNLVAGDTIESSGNYTLNVTGQLALLGTAALTATGNVAGDILIAGAGNDTLVANTPNQTLIGGSGNDTFVVSDSSDVVLDPYFSGNNVIVASTSYTLPANVDTLTLAGTDAATIAGNQDLNNVLTGNAAYDTIIGTAYNNTLTGGNATYYGLGYIYGGPGTNVIYAGDGVFSYVYGSSSLVGALPQNTIYGGAGDDYLFGGQGTDVIYTGSGPDTVTGGSGSDTLYGTNGRNVLIGGSGTSLIYGGSGTSLIQGGSGTSVIYGGTGTKVIDAGSGTNIIYVGNGGTTSSPFSVQGGASGTTVNTHTTIYGGNGVQDLFGGPGSDAIYAGTGKQFLTAGTGADSLYGNGAGDELIDNQSGRSLLVAGAGAEELQGTGGDTLVAGSGADLMWDFVSSAVGSVYEFNPGFGQATVGNGAGYQDTVATSANDTLSFGAGITLGNLTLSQSVIGGYYSEYSLALIINDGSSSIEVDGGMVPGVVRSVQIGGTTESFTQFMNSFGPGAVTVGSGGLTSDISTGDGQVLSDAGSTVWWVLWAFGNNDVITDTASRAPEGIYAFGNNDTVNSFGGWYGGNGDLIQLSAVNVLGAAADTLAGANDTLVTAANSFGGQDFIVAQSSDVVDVVTRGTFADSIDAFANYTLPTNVSYLTLDSTVGGLSGASNAQGGELIAGGSSDTLTGGPGQDTLYAQGANDVLVGGSGSEFYILTSATDSIQFGAGTPAQTTIEAGFSYTLPTAANTLLVAANYAVAAGNTANDFLEAGGVYDTVVAGAANDTLVAGGTSDVTLLGGPGSDTFWVTHTGDVIVDTAPGANDVLLASVNYSLPGFINVMDLVGSGFIVATANNGRDSITGNAGLDTIVAGTGNDTLVAGSAADTFLLNSGFGNDLIVANQGDVIQFGAGIAASNLTFTAVADASGTGPALVISGYGSAVTVEGGLIPGAVSAIDFSGGVSDSVTQLVAPSGPLTVPGSRGNLILLPTSSASITGGTGHDTLYGYGSSDTLNAGSGGAILYAGGDDDVATGSAAADTLVALGNADTLNGGSGSETFLVSNSSTVVQAVAGSQDTLLSSVSYSLPPNVATLVLTGTAALQGTGNAGNDVIIANSGNDTLAGGSGLATLIGGTGADFFVVTNTGDVIQTPHGSANDAVVADVSFTLPTGFNSIYANANYIAVTGNNQGDNLTIGMGNVLTGDTLYGGNGDDGMLSNGQEGALVAGSGNDYLKSAQGFTTMVSGTGIDTLVSVWEYDTLVINNSADVIPSIAAYDTIETPVSYTIPASMVAASYPTTTNIEYTVVATGTADLTITDQSPLSVELEGNSGNDVLIGGPGYNMFYVPSGGADTFIGGTGQNNFYAYDPRDVVIAQPGSVDTLQAAHSVTLPRYIDTLFLFGTGDYGLANSDNDTLMGNSCSLYGGSGNDSFYSEGYVTMVAGSGIDTVSSLNDQDAIVVNPGFGGVDVKQYNAHSDGPILEFGPGETASGLTASATSTGALRITDGSGTVTLEGALGGTPYRFQFGSNGPTLNIGQFLSQVNLVSTTLAGASGTGNVVFNGTSGTAVTGGSGNDTLAVAGTSDTLTAGSGAQYLEAFGQYDSVIGGTGADTAWGYGDNDTLVSNSTGSTSFLATVFGANDVLVGGAGGDVLTARGIGDTLLSGTGIEDLYSNQGLTTFVVNNASDYVEEDSAAPGDTLVSSVSFTLPSFIDTLLLAGSASIAGKGNTDNDLLVGGAGSDTLFAGSGADTLVAGSGPTKLVSGSGADLFVVNNTADVVSISGSHGTDSIQSSVSYTLPTGVNILILSGSGAITGTANASADLIIGNRGTDTLSASGSAATTLEGGGGNNTFNVTGTRDFVLESFAGVTDSINSTVSYTLPQNVSALTLTGTGPLLASGGTWGGVITGAPTGTDTLSAGALVSTLIGGGANNVLVVNDTRDVVTVTSTTVVDTIQSSVSYSLPANVTKLTFTGSNNVYGIGNNLNDTLTANNASDTLQAGSSADVLVGGTGADLFIINNTADTVSVGATHGADTVQSSVSYSLPTNVASLVLTGSANLNGTGSSTSGGTLTANAGADLLTAVGTATTLYGGAGNDTFSINSTTDAVIDTYTGTTNTLNTSVSYTLPTNVNVLNVTGTAAVLAVGNGGNDSLTANNANDTLVGLGSGSDTLVSGTSGVDSLVGGSGADVFVVRSTSDIVSVSTPNTNDTIQSSVTYSLPANVQYLMLTGTGTVTGTGNGSADLIVANSGTDTLNGGSGLAVLEGGTGTGAKGVFRATSAQAAFIGGGGGTTITGGAFKDFYAAGAGSTSITTGATANVICVNKGDTAVTVATTAGASDVLSLGAGIDTETLTLTKTSANLIVSDGSGDSITLTGWYSSSSNQVVKTLQVVEIASSSYNPSGSDPLRNQALEEFNFSALVTAFNNAGSPANWPLTPSTMTAAQLSSSPTAAYGGDLAYYYGRNNNLTGMTLSAAQSALTNSNFATATQTIDSWSSISGGGGIHLLAAQPAAGPAGQAPVLVDAVQMAWLSADRSAREVRPLGGSGELDPTAGYETSTLLVGSPSERLRNGRPEGGGERGRWESP